jgi:hypothetical protein
LPAQARFQRYEDDRHLIPLGRSALHELFTMSTCSFAIIEGAHSGHNDASPEQPKWAS